MAVLFPLPRFIAFDGLGAPLAFGKVYTYAAGTTTPKATYTNQGGGTPNTNPVELDENGSANIWLNGAYKIDIRDANDDSLPGYPVDNVIGYNPLDWTGLTATIAELNATDTSTITTLTNYTVNLTDRGKTILCNASSGSFTVSLPSAVSATNGFEITFKRTDATYSPSIPTNNIVTLDGNSSETIEGQTTYPLYDQNDVVTLLCDGSNWRIKSGVIRGVLYYQSTAFTVTSADLNKTFMCTATANYNVTLPSAVTVGNGFRVNFKKTADAYNVTLVPDGTEKIDGQTNYVLGTPYQVVGIMSDGANWYLESNTHAQQAQSGDVKYSWATTAQPGWIAWDDGTIGDATSGASTRANADTEDLFTLWWNAIANTWCPVSDSSGNPVARGATAAADFAAHRRIQMPRGKGKALGLAGAGSFVLTWSPDHTAETLTFSSNHIFFTGDVLQVSNNGGALPTGLTAATNYYVIYVSATVIKLATSLANAQAGTNLTFSDNGSGTQFATITLTTRALGEQVGEEAHSLTAAEGPLHKHNSDTEDGGGGSTNNVLATATSDNVDLYATDNSGSNSPANIMQPTVFGNAYIKL